MEELQPAQEVQETNPVSEVIEEGGTAADEYYSEAQPEDSFGLEEPQGEEAIEEPSYVEDESSSVNWEDEARKFQSMYDKTQSDNQKMQEFLMNQMEQSAPQGNEQQDSAKQVAIPSEDDFSPWDAYYKPGSPSYQFRASQEDQRIDDAVQTHLAQLNNQMVMNNTVKELNDNYKMEEQEVRDFMDFATTPRDQLPLETLVKVWSTGKNPSPNQSLEQIKSNRNAPRTAGVLQGQAPQPAKNEATKAWDSIMGAGGGIGSKIP